MNIANLTDEQKLKKFDELMSEYDKLTSYRNNLANMVMYGSEIIVSPREADNPGSYTINQEVRKLGPEQIKAIYYEIGRLDNVISFISNIIQDDGNEVAN